MDNRSEKCAGLGPQHEVMVAERVLQAAVRGQPLLRALVVTGAGYFTKAAAQARRRAQGIPEAVLVYCVKGGGWCEVEGRLHTLRQGDLLVLPPNLPHAYGAHVSHPWTIHWAHAAGADLPAYFKALGVSPQAPVVSPGVDLQLTLLFNDVMRALDSGTQFSHLLQAAHALGYLLALVVRRGQEQSNAPSDTVQKVARSIIYMSEHLDQPLRVTELAALANLSATHFSVLFKQQTGCSPRDYLHLLRIHRACQLLQDAELNVKEIAARLGYQDQFHFSRQFKAFQGVSPSEYRPRAMR